jgi:hypothetical protein
MRILLIFTFMTILAAPSFAKGHKKPAGTFVSWKEIPAPAQPTIQTAAAGGKIKEIQKIAAPAGVVYCAEVKGADGKWTKVYANEDGTLLKTEPDKARNNRKHKPLFGW